MTIHQGEYMFAHVHEIIETHKGCWFDKASMRFFRTRICAGSAVFGGKYFITSEKGPDMVRAYSIREYDAERDAIKTVGEFMGHDTLGGAKTAAKKLYKQEAA